MLDLGPGWNAQNSMIPLIRHYGPMNVKVIGIDYTNADALNTTLESLYLSSSDLYQVIDGDYTNRYILSSNGYGCGIAAYAFWPDVRGENDLPIASKNLLCGGGIMYVVSEEESQINRLRNQLAGFMTVVVDKKTYSDTCLSMSSCSPFGIGVTSDFSSSRNYVLDAIKK